MNLEGKKYGEIIVKTTLKNLEKYIKALKKIEIETYEIKVYRTHFTKRIIKKERR